MNVVRAIRMEDLDGLYSLTTQVGGGMTSLKPDKKMLAKRITVACDSFAEKNCPEQRDFLFVMEDTATKEIVGVCAIKSKVGLEDPFYNYRIGTLVHSSKELDVHSHMDVLYLSNDLTGYSELCSLFLRPDYRMHANGKLLSKSRFLFIAQFPHFFSKKLIAELRGFQRPDGSSPFWDNVGRHFFQMDFSQADDLTISEKKSFITDLMPHYPLYVTCLSEEAQQVIGQVHVATEPARHLLEEEGFYFEGYIDIFDAGPVLQTRVSELRSSRISQLVDVVDLIDPANNHESKEATLIANTNLQDYRVILSDIPSEHGQVQLTAEQQQMLCCGVSEQVRVMSLHVKKDQHA